MVCEEVDDGAFASAGLSDEDDMACLRRWSAYVVRCEDVSNVRTCTICNFPCLGLNPTEKSLGLGFDGTRLG